MAEKRQVIETIRWVLVVPVSAYVFSLALLLVANLLALICLPFPKVYDAANSGSLLGWLNFCITMTASGLAGIATAYAIAPSYKLRTVQAILALALILTAWQLQLVIGIMAPLHLDTNAAVSYLLCLAIETFILIAVSTILNPSRFNLNSQKTHDNS